MFNSIKTNSLRASGFRTTTALRQSSIISRGSQYLFQRPISYEVKKIYSSNDRHENLELIELKNDKNEGQDIVSYCQESKDTFLKKLKPYRLYVCVDKASASKDYIEPGHIATYLTDRDSKIIDDSFISLRNAKKRIENKELIYRHPIENKLSTNSVWKVKFFNVDEELQEKFLKKAEQLLKGHRRYLISIPISYIVTLMEGKKLDLNNQDSVIRYLTERAVDIKHKLAEKEYILCKGVVNTTYKGKVEVTEERDSLNCVTAAILALNVRDAGNPPESNPSPQMLARSYLNLLGEEDEKIANKLTGELLLDVRKRDMSLELDLENKFFAKVLSSSKHQERFKKE